MPAATSRVARTPVCSCSCARGSRSTRTRRRHATSISARPRHRRAAACTACAATTRRAAFWRARSANVPELTAVRGAAVLFWLISAGFGLYAFPAAAHLVQHRELPMTMFGFRAYGGGPFERFSPETLAIILGLFVGLCAVEAFAGWLLWTGSRA